jgi:hypothetical protein
MKMLDISLYLLEKYVYETVVSHNAYYFRGDLKSLYELLVHTYKGGSLEPWSQIR